MGFVWKKHLDLANTLSSVNPCPPVTHPVTHRFAANSRVLCPSFFPPHPKTPAGILGQQRCSDQPQPSCHPPVVLNLPSHTHQSVCVCSLRLQGVYLAEFDRRYTNPYVGSQFDDATHGFDPRAVATAAALLARALDTLALGPSRSPALQPLMVGV